MNTPALHAHATLAAALPLADALVLVVASPLPAQLAALDLPPAARKALEAAFAADEALAKGPTVPHLLPVAELPGGRLIVVSPGTLADDADDVRAIADAARDGVARAVAAGAKQPALLLAVPNEARYARAREVAALAGLGTAWVPLEAREAGKGGKPLTALHVVGLTAAEASFCAAIEAGRRLARDITGTEPERMAPRRVAALVKEVFAGTRVKVEVFEDVAKWPLLAAVARASQLVARHQPCVIRLELAPSGPVTRTLGIAGKGVTYDTGGADLKVEGSMAGMSRDKGGAGAAAGLMLTLDRLALPGVRVVTYLGMVRNSVGEEAFVSDEIIPSRAGVRVRIGNTDAEGRLVLADLLAELKEELAGAPDPTLLTIATLTGHAHRAYGPIGACVQNRAAFEKQRVQGLAQHGEGIGEPIEFSRPRREDFALLLPKSAAEDLLSSNRLATVNTPRGHQFPFAFLDAAAGLKGGSLPFVHFDIAGLVCQPADWQGGRPTGAPVAVIASWLAGR